MKANQFSKGLTFIELMIAITILAIAIVSILVAINFASKVSRHNLNKTMAMNLVMEKLEMIKYDRDRTDPGYGYDYITTANYPNESNIAVGTDPVRFSRTVSITIGDYKTVTVTVKWRQLHPDSIPDDLPPFIESESATTIISP